MTETTKRFLQEIATRVGYDRVAELYLFPVLRQGGVEGAVAVVAAYPEPERADSVGTEHDSAAADADASVEADDATASLAETDASAESDAPHPQRARHVVYTARYRHTIKGTDRGRWIVEIVAEGDAPLITVEEVVRGVVRRSGDAFQPERISGEQFRAIVPAPAAPGSAPA